MQEVAAAPGNAVQCGDDILAWHHLMDAYKVMLQHSNCMVHVPSFPQSYEARAIITGASRATAIWALINNNKVNFHCARIAAMEGTCLVTVLESLRTLYTTDLRDKVYAACGLAGTDGGLTPVDYSLSVTSVYVGVVERSVAESQSFYALAYCHYPSSLTDLPTWAPD